MKIYNKTLETLAGISWFICIVTLAGLYGSYELGTITASDIFQIKFMLTVFISIMIILVNSYKYEVFSFCMSTVLIVETIIARSKSNKSKKDKALLRYSDQFDSLCECFAATYVLERDILKGDKYA